MIAFLPSLASAQQVIELPARVHHLLCATERCVIVRGLPHTNPDNRTPSCVITRRAGDFIDARIVSLPISVCQRGPAIRTRYTKRIPQSFPEYAQPGWGAQLERGITGRNTYPDYVCWEVDTETGGVHYVRLIEDRSICGGVPRSRFDSRRGWIDDTDRNTSPGSRDDGETPARRSSGTAVSQ